MAFEPYKIYKRPSQDNDDLSEIFRTILVHPNWKGNIQVDGLKNDVVQECLKYLSDVFNSNFSHDSPNAFTITDHIDIHGGCCRDSILHRPIKDIDLSVDLHSLHLHASKCENVNCKLRKNWKEEDYISVRYPKKKNPIATPYPSVPSLDNVDAILHGYLLSTRIINTRWLLKTLKQDKNFNKYCSSIKGPNVRANTLVTHQIYFKNGVDIDIMDCSSFITEYTEFNKETWITFKWPITHELHARMADATFNSLFIPISSIVGVDIKQWGKYVVDPYTKYKMARRNYIKRTNENFIVSAIKDLQTGVVRAYKASEATKKPRYGNQKGTGQSELIIFRTIKNVSKLKGRNIIYIDTELQYSIQRGIYLFFDPKELMKEQTKHGDGLDSVLHHIFNHNYFRKIDDDTVIAIYHLFRYNSYIYWYYLNKDIFRSKVDKLLETSSKRASTLWQRIKETASSRIEYYQEGGPIVSPMKYIRDPPKKYEAKNGKCVFKIKYN
eukprot:271750_1